MTESERKRYYYCNECNKIYPISISSLETELDGVECPRCESGELIDLGELTPLQLKMFRFNVASESFDIERWRHHEE